MNFLGLCFSEDTDLICDVVKGAGGINKSVLFIAESEFSRLTK